MILGIWRERFQYMRKDLTKEVISHSWLETDKFLRNFPAREYSCIANYYLTSVDSVINERTEQENQSKETVGQEITGHQLLSLCFNDRLRPDFGKVDALVESTRMARRPRASCAAVAATKGYFPAQAVALQLLDGTESRFLEKVRSSHAQWQWNAVSTGYILAWEFAHGNPDEHAAALCQFQKSGGYNCHYISPVSGGSPIYDPCGLLHNPLAWLTAYPLHRAAALGDLSEIERLVGLIDVDSRDGIGETPLQRACMAGAYSSVCCLVKHGADPTIKSASLGTVPLHWLFVFEAKEIPDTVVLLTSKDTSVLRELSTPNTKAFHYPFRWPVGTPLEWAVLSNRSEAVNVLLELDPALDSITDFFPGPPEWTKQLYGANPDTRDKTYGSEYRLKDPNHELWSVWIYNTMERHRLAAVQRSQAYQAQFKRLSSRKTRRDFHGPNTPGGGLIAAVIEDNIAEVKKQIASGADINHVSKAGLRVPVTALMSAIDQRNQPIVQLLLDNGARYDFPDFPDQTPLQNAVASRQEGIVKILLDRGADVNGQGCGVIPLAQAAISGSPTMVKLLLLYNADHRIGCDSDMNVLEAAVFGNNFETVALLLKRGADPNTPGTWYPIGNALQLAAYHGSAKILRGLLDNGGDPNIRGGCYDTTIQAAICPSTHRMWKQQTPVVQMLLMEGVDVGVSGGKYGSVVQAAACSTDEALVKLLLDAGAPVDIGGGPHGSALQAAVKWNKDLNIAQLLLDHGAHPDFDDDGKWDTPLQIAIHRDNEEQVELLLKRGADPNNPRGLGSYRSLLEMAGVGGNKRVIQTLLDWGAQNDSEPDRWNSMLDQVCASPISPWDLSSVRSRLIRCFKQPNGISPRALSSAQLADKVIDNAEYWLAELSQRHQKGTASECAPYLKVKLKDWPTPNMRARRVVFRIKSHDTNPTKMPEFQREDPYHNSEIWFEVGVRSSNTADENQPRLLVQKNFCGSLTTRTHHVIWDLGDKVMRVSRFLGGLEPGDTVDVYARGTNEGLDPNDVDFVEVIVFYSHQ